MKKIIFLLSVFFIFINTAIADDKPDICYSSKETSGICVFGSCAFYKETLNIKAISNGLSNINVKKALTRGFAFGDFASEIGINDHKKTLKPGDDEAEKKSFISADFLNSSFFNASIFPEGLEYRIGNGADATKGGSLNANDTVSIYDTSFIKFGLFTQYTYIITYTKNGKTYQEVLQPCNPDGSESLKPAPIINQCGVFLSALNSHTKIIFNTATGIWQTINNNNSDNTLNYYLNTPLIQDKNQTALCSNQHCKANGVGSSVLALPDFRNSKKSSKVNITYSVVIPDQQVGELDISTDSKTPEEEPNRTIVFEAPYSPSYGKRVMFIKSIIDHDDHANKYTYVFKEGDYWIGNWDIDKSKSVEIKTVGKVRFFINNDFYITNSGTLYIGHGGDGNTPKFYMYVYGNFGINVTGATAIQNGYIYSKGNMTLGTTNTIALDWGALTAEGELKIKNGAPSTFNYYPDSSNSELFKKCSSNNNNNKSEGSFNVVEPTFNASIDPLDENNYLNQIYTKIVNKPFNMKVIKLKNDNKTLENYTGIVKVDIIKNPNNENECKTNPSLWSEFVGFNNENSKIINNIIFGKANKDLKFRIKYLDFSFPESCTNLFNRVIYNVTNSSFGSSVSECVGDLQSMSGNEVGCISYLTSNRDTNVSRKVYSFLKCIFRNANSVCSRDDFAIRPYKYKVKAINKKLIAAEDTNITILPLDYRGNLIGDFNFSNAPIELNVTDIKGCNTGNFEPNQVTVNFINGEANLTAFKYYDVGDINISVKEYKNGNEFAAVDENDAVNSNGETESNNTLLIKEGNSSIGTFYPHHFSLTDTTYHNYQNSNFTYISSDLNMSSVLYLNITAKNADNGTTYNYNKNCYAKNFDVNISHSIPNELNSNTLILYKDENGNEHNVTLNNDINLTNLPKTYFSTDHNGSAVFKIYINLDKNYTTPVTEFNFTINEINVSDINDTFGTNDIDQNATFRYGRIHVENLSGYSKDLNTTFKYEYWSGDGWVVNKEHNSTDFGDINISKSYHPNINMSILSQNGKNILEGKEKIKISTSHAIPYSAKIHLSIPSWLWYHPLAKPYQDPSSSNLDCLTHPCFNVSFQKESSGWGGIASNNVSEDYNETNRTSDINASLKRINVDKNTLKKINW